MKGQEELHYAGEVYYYDIVRSDRKTLALQVRPGGAVLVLAPRRMKADTIRRFVWEHRDWLRKKVLESRCEIGRAHV